MIIKIPQIVRQAINEMPYNKSVKNNALKIYAALYKKSHLKNSYGFFPVPSIYLKSINLRYYRILDYFIDKNIIDYYKKAYQDENDIFNTIWKKSYNRDLGICARYKFLINTEVGDEIDVNLVYKAMDWWEIIENSLIEVGLPAKIKRDDFGRRVHHSGIRNYKQDFAGFYMIDSVCSQPRLLYLLLREKNIVEPSFNEIFENDKDFYFETALKIGLEGKKHEKRDEMKEIFMQWINGNGYVKNRTIHEVYPIVSAFIKKQKKGNYKNLCSQLQRIESKIWIDDLLTNIPADFAVPIHDCLIVKEEDVDRVLDYCTNKYPELRFKKEIIEQEY